MSSEILTRIPGDRRITAQITLTKESATTEPLYDLEQDGEIVEFTATQLRDLREELCRGRKLGVLP